MYATEQQASYDEREFVASHVRRIARNMGVTNGIAEMATVDALGALDRGCDRFIAVNIGLKAAASARVAHVSRSPVRKPPVLRLVRSEPEQAPPWAVREHSVGSWVLMAIGAVLICVAVVAGLAP